MSDQAIQTDGEVEISEEVVEDVEAVEEVTEEAPPESDEVEIVLEGDDEPASKPRRRNKLQQRFSRLTGQRDEARGEVAERDATIARLTEENKLLRLNAEQHLQKAPKPEDFETDEQFNDAKARYDEALISAKAEEIVNKRLEQSETQTTQFRQNRETEAKLREHDDRTESLQVDDYDETEDKAIDVMGEDLSRTIMTTFPKSELLMYYLGKNPVKAESLVALSQVNPVACVAEIGRLEERLKIKPKTGTAPNPETEVKGGVSSETQGPPGATFE